MPCVTTTPPILPEEPDPTETIEFPGAERSRDVASPGERGYALIVASGPRRGMHWPLENGVEAGRHLDAAIFLDDVSVSRHHCMFLIEDARLEVRDLGSTNGTYVNGTRCDRADLKAGDQVIIGRFHLIVAHEE